MSLAEQAVTEAATGTPLLAVRDLKTHYRVRRSAAGQDAGGRKRLLRAVDGVSFDVRKGEMLALVGESGCGKTTVVQSVLRLTEPTSGSVLFDGIDLRQLPARRMRPLRQRLQVIEQDPYESLDPRFRVRQIVEEPLLVHGLGGSRRERREVILQALERAGLSPAEQYLERHPHELSGGQRQRVAIATSLVLGPELLLADEPVSMLDVSVRAGILSLLDTLRREGDLAIVMITHDLSTAAHFADRIAVMYLGRIVEEGPARDVVENPRHPYTRALVSAVPKRDPRDTTRAEILSGETPNPVSVPSGCRFHPRCPIAVAQCRDIDPELRPPAEPAAPDHRVACILS
ncbi:MAG TPA: ABC transporter ATP-binding protein [Streptosporangiaceae bacterium]